MLPELVNEDSGEPLGKEYSSGDAVLSLQHTAELLKRYNLLIGQAIEEEGEFLR